MFSNFSRKHSPKSCKLISNPDSIESIYGHISDWDVSNVTDMPICFNHSYILMMTFQVGMYLMLLI